jgi:hypothetical protein
MKQVPSLRTVPISSGRPGRTFESRRGKSLDKGRERGRM